MFSITHNHSDTQPKMSLLDCAIFASVSAMSVFALFSPLF